VCGPPAAPSDLQAVASSAQEVDLSWTDNADDESGFVVERNLDGDPFTPVATVGPDVTSYADLGLIPERSYCYRISAFSDDGVSPYSDLSCATTPPPALGECADSGGHDSLADLWNISIVEADRNRHWKANQRPGCEIRAWYLGIDSGVDSDHPDLNVVEALNFVAAEPTHDGEDENGHGTHTAGSAAAIDGNGGVVGIAPGAPIYGFRVCGTDDSCSLDDILAALDAVWSRKMAHPTQPMVANLSLAGPASDIFDTMIRRAANAGVTVVMAAGNGFFGACLIPNNAASISPARTGDDAINPAHGSDGDTQRINGAITVTSSTSTDADANCNYGNPVTVAAPGVGIRSTGLNGGHFTTSGTSMASPHVAGAAILFLQSYPTATPMEVEQAIVNQLAPWITNEAPSALGRLDAGGL
jgi:hypothetical protein